MITRVVFRDPPDLPASLRDPQPRLRGWQWLSIGLVFGLGLGVLTGMSTAPRLSPEAERLNRLVQEAHLIRLKRATDEQAKQRRFTRTGSALPAGAGAE